MALANTEMTQWQNQLKKRCWAKIQCPCSWRSFSTPNSSYIRLCKTFFTPFDQNDHNSAASYYMVVLVKNFSMKGGGWYIPLKTGSHRLLVEIIVPFLSVQTGPLWPRTRTWPLTSRAGTSCRGEPGTIEQTNIRFKYLENSCPCFHVLDLCTCVPKISKSSALLQSLSKHLILANIVVTDGTTSKPHCFLKVVFPDLRDWIKVLILQEKKQQT